MYSVWYTTYLNYITNFYFIFRWIKLCSIETYTYAAKILCLNLSRFNLSLLFLFFIFCLLLLTLLVVASLYTSFFFHLLENIMLVVYFDLVYRVKLSDEYYENRTDNDARDNFSQRQSTVINAPRVKQFPYITRERNFQLTSIIWNVRRWLSRLTGQHAAAAATATAICLRNTFYRRSKFGCFFLWAK